MSRKSRYLRIAWSIFCGILCLLLIALWVRSYAKFDHLWVPITSTRTLCVMSCRGYASIGFPPVQYFRDMGHLNNWEHSSEAAGNMTLVSNTRSLFGVHWTSNRPPRRGLQIIVPFWAPTILFGVCGVFFLSKQRPRFSLRILLIATTLIALAMGYATLR
jgi:hypothetical protein